VLRPLKIRRGRRTHTGVVRAPSKQDITLKFFDFALSNRANSSDFPRPRLACASTVSIRSGYSCATPHGRNNFYYCQRTLPLGLSLAKRLTAFLPGCLESTSRAQPQQRSGCAAAAELQLWWEGFTPLRNNVRRRISRTSGGALPLGPGDFPIVRDGICELNSGPSPVRRLFSPPPPNR
jgi:hypothetical protein